MGQDRPFPFKRTVQCTYLRNLDKNFNQEKQIKFKNIKINTIMAGVLD